jgi:ABC-type transporter Mla MlaB component
MSTADAVLVVVGPVADGDAGALCSHLRTLIGARDGPGTDVVCDVRGLAADVAGVETLARLALTARRLGCSISLRDASDELVRLLAFCGLRGVLPLGRLEP